MAVFGRNTGTQTELFKNGVVAEVVVKMSVSCQEVEGMQVVVLDIVDDRLPLFGVESPTVDDGRTPRFVTDDVAILLEHVANKCFYRYHVNKNKLYIFL